MTTERIIWARYGVREHGQWIDVAQYLPLISPHRIGPDVFPEVPGAKGKERALWLAVQAGGKRHELTVKDGEVFPPPTWPKNWRDVLYATRRPKSVVGGVDNHAGAGVNDSSGNVHSMDGGLRIIQAHYGIGSLDDLDVRERLQSLVVNDSLDIIVNNSTLVPGQNPFRGQKKQLNVTYSYDSGDVITATRQEKEALIIGQPQRRELASGVNILAGTKSGKYHLPDGGVVSDQGMVKPVEADSGRAVVNEIVLGSPRTPAALNDYLIRKFSISPYRLRAPMPIELPNFHRNDLAQLFAELGFRRGAEIGVAEGNYSEVLLEANPTCELLLVDPWHAYSDNPQNKSKEKHEFAFDEVIRKTKDYPNVKMVKDYSMNAVRDVGYASLDFVYIDGMHSYSYVMSDLFEWTARVRSGGIIALDDWYYIDRARWGAGVVEAVQDFTRAYDIKPWFICQGHRSIDAFWVNP